MTAPFFDSAARDSDRSVSVAGTAHLVGIAGSGMKALAEYLCGLGWRISGSDQRQTSVCESMRRLGLRIHTGHEDNFLPAKCDLLIYSSAIPENNPERSEARRRGVRQLSLTQAVAEMTSSRESIGVAGTHGKSTTTALIASILQAAGEQPGAIIGAERRSDGQSGWAGNGMRVVVEACEYQRNLLNLKPTHAVLLNVEPDHFDTYPDVSSLSDTFAEFAGKLPQSGVLAVRGDCDHCRRAVRGISARPVTFSLLEGSDYWAADLRASGDGTRFRVFRQAEYLAEMTLRIAGEHNVWNALAATTLCHELGVSLRAIQEGLWEFAGMRRRFEPVGTWCGRQLIDDYAHHPTAVKAAIAAARVQYPRRRVICIFQPHQISRTAALLNDFAAALSLADAVFLLPIYAAREPETSERTRSLANGGSVGIAKRLAELVADAGVFSRFLPSLDSVPEAVDDGTRPGDVVITLGAGDIDRVHHEFSRRLRRHRSAG